MIVLPAPALGFGDGGGVGYGGWNEGTVGGFVDFVAVFGEVGDEAAAEAVAGGDEAVVFLDLRVGDVGGDGLGGAFFGGAFEVLGIGEFAGVGEDDGLVAIELGEVESHLVDDVEFDGIGGAVDGDVALEDGFEFFEAFAGEDGDVGKFVGVGAVGVDGMPGAVLGGDEFALGGAGAGGELGVGSVGCELGFG